MHLQWISRRRQQQQRLRLPRCLPPACHETLHRSRARRGARSPGHLRSGRAGAYSEGRRQSIRSCQRLLHADAMQSGKVRHIVARTSAAPHRSRRRHTRDWIRHRSTRAEQLANDRNRAARERAEMLDFHASMSSAYSPFSHSGLKKSPSGWFSSTITYGCGDASVSVAWLQPRARQSTVRHGEQRYQRRYADLCRTGNVLCLTVEDARGVMQRAHLSAAVAWDSADCPSSEPQTTSAA